MPAARRYTIEIRDQQTGKTLLFSAVDLTRAELKTLIARNLRLFDLPDDAGLTAPDEGALAGFRAANDEDDCR